MASLKMQVCIRYHQKKNKKNISNFLIKIHFQIFTHPQKCQSHQNKGGNIILLSHAMIEHNFFMFLYVAKKKSRNFNSSSALNFEFFCIESSPFFLYPFLLYFLVLFIEIPSGRRKKNNKIILALLCMILILFLINFKKSDFYTFFFYFSLCWKYFIFYHLYNLKAK